jgi:hypothetical protein
LLLVLAACAAAAALVWATTGHAARTAGSCPSVPAGPTVGYAAAGSVGSTVVVETTTAKAGIRHARRLRHARRHATAPPGQMPPYITKTAADPACVPTPGSSGTAPTPAP